MFMFFSWILTIILSIFRAITNYLNIFLLTVYFHVDALKFVRIFSTWNLGHFQLFAIINNTVESNFVYKCCVCFWAYVYAFFSPIYYFALLIHVTQITTGLKRFSFVRL